MARITGFYPDRWGFESSGRHARKGSEYESTMAAAAGDLPEMRCRWRAARALVYAQMKVIEWWPRPDCIHRSHLLRLPCFRQRTWQSMCWKHNSSGCNDPVTGREDDACAFWKRAVAENDRHH